MNQTQRTSPCVMVIFGDRRFSKTPFSPLYNLAKGSFCGEFRSHRRRAAGTQKSDFRHQIIADLKKSLILPIKLIKWFEELYTGGDFDDGKTITDIKTFSAKFARSDIGRISFITSHRRRFSRTSPEKNSTKRIGKKKRTLAPIYFRETVRTT